jgi:hypothetical protein
VRAYSVRRRSGCEIFLTVASIINCFLKIERDFYSRPDYVRKNLRHSKDARLKVWQATSIKSAAMEVNFFDRVLCLYRENKWKDLLDLRVESVAEARKLLWVWPSESNLKLIKSVVQGFGLKGVISIGCGCGLFEWLLQQYSGKTLSDM